uniref:Uncharacterized protein n=1 Tax=Micrurus spixii TaxID=129469 RepID=A0A2D4MJQ5_9SAUR
MIRSCDDMENSLQVMFHESCFLHMWAALKPSSVVASCPLKTCNNAIFPLPSPPSSVYTGYFKLLSVATTLMQQLVLECSLMSVPPGCGPLLPVNTSGLICCIITIWLLLISLKSKRIKAGVLELCP